MYAEILIQEVTGAMHYWIWVVCCFPFFHAVPLASAISHCLSRFSPFMVGCYPSKIKEPKCRWGTINQVIDRVWRLKDELEQADSLDTKQTAWTPSRPALPTPTDPWRCPRRWWMMPSGALPRNKSPGQLARDRTLQNERQPSTSAAEGNAADGLDEQHGIHQG